MLQGDSKGFASMRFHRTKCHCNECPFRDTRKVYGEGEQGQIMFIGEAPGKDEDRDGKPFVGSAGRYFNYGLGISQIARYANYVTNTILCRPPNNIIDSGEGSTAIECCKEGLEEEIAYIKPKVICVLGATAAQVLGISNTITKVRGSVYLYNNIPVIPTFHPSYLNRMQFNKGEGEKTSLKFVWFADLEKVKDICIKGWQPPKELFNVYPTVAEVEAFCQSALVSDSLIACDIETAGSDIVVIGLAKNGEEAISIPFLKQGGESYWDESELQETFGILRSFFSRAKLMFQNAIFDVPRLRRKGFEIAYSQIAHDTLLLHHSIHPELPHNLGFIVSTYGRTPYWKDTLKLSVGGALGLPDDELRTYNLRDAVVLHQVLPDMLADLAEIKTERIYYEESLKMLKPVIQMMDNGIAISQDRLKEWNKLILARKVEQEKGLVNLGNLPVGFNLESKEDLRWLLFGIHPAKFKRLETLEGKKRKDTKVYKQLLELKTIAEMAPLYIAEGFKARRTDTGLMSVNEQGLLSLRRHLQNRLVGLQALVRRQEKHDVEQAKITRCLEWLALYSDYAETAKLASTYLDIPTALDGRVHSSFLIHGTATRRLSSKDPNLQNIPKKETFIRKIFVAEPGNRLISGDYSGLEVGVLAYECEDEKMIYDFEHGISPHKGNAKLLFNIQEDHPYWAEGYAAAKTFQFGGLSYGGGDQEIYEKVILKAPHLNLTFNAFKQGKERWMFEHPRYAQWRQKITDTVLRERKLYDAFGRVRIFLGDERDIVKEGLNFPIQAGASGIINKAMITLADRLEGSRTRLILQVHDQLLLESPEDETWEMGRTLKEIMETPISFRGVMRKFPIELEMGPSWGELVKVEK